MNKLKPAIDAINDEIATLDGEVAERQARIAELRQARNMLSGKKPDAAPVEEKKKRQPRTPKAPKLTPALIDQKEGAKGNTLENLQL